MSQCVPSWDLDEPPNPPSRLLPSSSGPHGPMPDYELAELTWENGQLSKHGLGGRPRVGKPAAKYPDTATGTLESVVDQATRHHLHHVAGRSPVPAAAVEALVPSCQNPDAVDFASGIGSCGSGVRRVGNKRARAEESATDDFGFTTTSATLSPEDGGGSPETENASFAGGGGGGHDSVCHSRRSQSQREGLGEEEEEKGPTNNSKGQTVRSISTKRSRAAAIHNQSERKRRDKINQRMRTLQKLVPNSSKTDKASMLDEVIEYLKQLQAQVQMMSRMSSIPTPVMMPMSMQQLQMSMMAQMAQMAQLAHMGLGMGIMDMNSFSRAGPWDVPVGRMHQPGGTMAPESFSAFRAYPTQQPVGTDGYQRMAALYQQLYQLNPPSVPKT